MTKSTSETTERPPVQWPDTVGRDAYHGLAGRIVDAIAPHTEADPMAILIQLLVIFGNVVGHKPHFMVEADRHALNLFAVLVGATSKGRKGTSLGHVQRLFGRCDPDWAFRCVASGLSSGEGLIWAVRDGDAVTTEGVAVAPAKDRKPDIGVSDKRLLPIESEFSSTLRVLSRDGNVLSSTIRQAWDSGDLRILTKNEPARATGAHISIIGHISADELRRELTATDKANGFANRFVWVCVRRARTLPDGGNLDANVLEPLVRELSDAVAFGREADQIRRSPEANQLWHDVYQALSEGRPGLVGAMLARAEAQVMRIASVYALLDKSVTIGLAHLKAALAVWAYFEASVRFIFRDALGDPLAEQVLHALRGAPAGLTRTHLRDTFSRHAAAEQIDRALNLLAEGGLARLEKQPTGGRPAERWFAIV